MPTIWRILYWIDHLNRSTDLSIGLNELDHVYDLTNFENSFFLLKVKDKRFPLLLKFMHNYAASKGKYFFFRHDSIPNGTIYLSLGLERVGFYISNS